MPINESPPGNPNNLTEVSSSDPNNPSNLTEVSAADPSNPSNLAEVSASDPSNPSNLAEVSASDPGNPSNLTTASSSDPSNPSTLTTASSSDPNNPSNLTEVSTSDPGNPSNLTEVSSSDPGNPSNLTEVSASDPSNPSNLTEVSGSDPSNPSNLTEVSSSDPSNPSNLTEISSSDPGNPTSLTAVAEAVIPRTLTPRIDLNFESQGYEFDGEASALEDLNGFTYSRASSATYIDRFVNQYGQYDYILREDFNGSVTNLVTYSENFAQDWAATRITVTGRRETDQNNQKTMTVINGTTDSGTHALTFTTTVTSGATCTFSIDVKALGLDYVMIFNDQIARGWYFDVKRGHIGDNYLTGAVLPAIECLGNDVYRCSLTSTAPSTTFSGGVYLAKLGLVSFVDEDRPAIAVNRAQVTETSKPRPYVQTFSSSATKSFSASPRIEWDASTGECLGYLAETASTNLKTLSEELDDGSYIKTGVTATADQGLAPDFTQSADKIAEDSSTGLHLIRSVNAVTASTQYTFSVFIKAQERTIVTLGDSTALMAREFDIANLSSTTASFWGAPDAYSIQDVGNGWRRISITTTPASSSTEFRLYFTEPSGTISYAGTTGSGFLIWGWQIEQFPYATSYIRTELSTVSRSDDEMNITIGNIGPDISLFANARYLGSSALGSGGRVISEINDGTSNRYSMVNNSGYFASAYLFSGSVLSDASTLVSSADFNKIVAALSATSNVMYYNGAATQTATNSAPAPTIYSLDVANQRNAAQLNGHVKQVTIWDTTLTASEVSKL